MAGHEHLTPARPRGHPDLTGTPVLRGLGTGDPRTRLARTPAPPSRARADPPRGKYVYGIIEAKQALDLGPIGIGEGRNPVYTIHSGELAAVVSDTPLELHDASRENLLSHEIVNQTVLRDHTLLPVSFGTVFRNEEDVLELLRSAGKAFGDVLAQVRGKVELGVKALWDRERVLERIESEHPEIRDLKREITETRAGSTYFARLRLGRLVEAALDERADRYVTGTWEALRPFASASRLLKPIGDRMILNGAFLVDRSRESGFRSAVEDVGTTYADVLALACTGPWPAYNFVNINLSLERAD